MKLNSVYLSRIVYIVLLIVHLFAINASAELLADKDQVESLIESGRLADAQSQIEQLKVEYSENTKLPEALYWIAERYRWSGKYEEAKAIHQQIMRDHSNTTCADKARLAVSRIDISSLIKAGSYNKAQKEVDKLVVDFEGHEDLPESLYWIGRGFGWNNRYEEEKNLYQQIKLNFPDSTYVKRSQLDLSRAQIMLLIVSKEYDAAQTAITKLTSDFSGHSDLPETLYRIGERYRWSDEYEKAKEIYEQVIQTYPQSPFEEMARQQLNVIVQGIEIFALIESGLQQQAQDAINLLMANPAEDENDDISLYTVFLCGDRYYAKGLQKREQGLKDEAVANFAKALDIWKQIIHQSPACDTKSHAYYRSANCFADMGQYGRAVEMYTELLENYPDYYLAWDAQFKIGRYYQKLKDSKTVDSLSADNNTKAAYEAVLEKYPDCPAAKATENWVKKHAK